MIIATTHLLRINTVFRQLNELKDTVSLAVVSLDLSSRVYPIIYSLDNLPYDCTKLYAVPKPAVGLMIISANSLIYVAQGSPGIGVAVNGYTKSVTNFPGMIYDPKVTAMELELEGAKCVLLGGTRMCLFLRDGQWLTVEMLLDGSKVVGFNIERVEGQGGDEKKNSHIATVPSCTATIKNGYFFLGSRVSDSLLVKWEWPSNQTTNKNRVGRPHMPSRSSTGDLASGMTSF
jgi:cleavage and polyadenylation specificity factor subunit 1